MDYFDVVILELNVSTCMLASYPELPCCGMWMGIHPLPVSEAVTYRSLGMKLSTRRSPG